VLPVKASQKGETVVRMTWTLDCILFLRMWRIVGGLIVRVMTMGQSGWKIHIDRR